MSLQIQLKKSAVSQKQPFASDLAVGELALNYNADGPFLTCKDTAGNVRKLNNVWVAATAPTSPSAGDLWLDTSSATPVLKAYKDSITTWVGATSVPLATTTVFGTVRLASAADVTNGTSGKVVDAAQLQSKVAAEISSALNASPTTIQDLTVSNNATITGNLTVNGTTTTIDTTNLLVEDKNIEMGVVATPTNTTADGGGITLRGATNKTINWVNATGAWTSSERFSYPLGTAAAPTLTFTGDPNTGIYSPGADQLALSTNGTGRLFVDSSGNVGVGATPLSAHQLTVNGSSLARIALQTSTLGQTGSDGFALEMDSSGLYFTNRENIPSIFYTNNQERLRITSAGLVGIGTSAPADVLHINGGQIRIQKNVPQILFRSADGSSNQYYIGANISDTVDGGFLIGEGPGITGGTPRIAITGTGNVGIGTESPATTLDVRGTLTVNTNQKFVQFNDGTNDVARLTYAGTGQFVIDANGPSTQSTQFWINGTERARLDSSGRLLVGTSSARTLFTGYTPALQVEASTAGASCASIVNTQSAVGGPVLFLAHSRGTNGLVNAGDDLGAISFHGGDDTDLQSIGASIVAKVDGTPGANDMPGRLVFSTTADGASSPTERVRIDNAGTTTLTSATSTAPFIAKISTSEVARIDSSGRLLVGTSSSVAAGSSTASTLQVSQGAGGVGASFYSIANAAGPAGILVLGHGRATPEGLLSANDALGQIRFAGGDGTDLQTLGAQISAEVDGTPGANDMPGRLVFSVTADGAASPTEALRISSNRAITVSDGGNIVVGTTTGTKIGTATSQKIGFFNATPVVQPTTGVAEAAFVENSGGTAVNVDSTFGGYTLQQVVQALQNLGILA